MMQESPVSRRAVLAGGAGLCAGLAGCISTSATPPSQAGGNDSGGGGGNENVPTLRLGGSSTVFPIVDRAASFWGTNAAPPDEEYWTPDEYGISTDERLADYWAGQYGFDAIDSETPPIAVSVELSHSGTGLENLRKGRLDLGNSSAPVKAEFPELEQAELSKYTDHVVGVDAQPIVVSGAIAEAGVEKISAETLKGIYAGDITDWRDVPGYEGPKVEIQTVGRAEGSGTDTAFRNNLFGDSDAPIPGVDSRKGQNQQVRQIVANSDNAIAYMALAFVDDSVSTIALTFDGTEYVPGENLAEGGYPLARDLHCYTWDGTSKKEAAFVRMILSEYGQANFVKGAGYAVLTDKRQQRQRDKLPTPQQ
ncbi:MULTISPECIES: PstS family phosphate ABC transporter substrate-binding protein [Halococcus]|uniref:Phosphate ABC transporter substrate-binding protein, phot family n=1 Tax=Halococcus salifodinae DSM 8989 TaxID=1227456 RepID=M0ND80_9EURY|nr:substrate-binding domain-containing protein [Halococcus sp. PRR34]EMA55942.1 phosphate ABC transporter substrate-binding protein, phot family [Halococcus salifodinae DSM 8989]